MHPPRHIEPFKDIGIPQCLEEAAQIIAAGHTREIDVGRVNDRIFLNNSSIGLYPHMVLRRERQQVTLGRSKWHAALSAALKVLRWRPFFRVKMLVDGKVRVHQKRRSFSSGTMSMRWSCITLAHAHGSTPES